MNDNPEGAPNPLNPAPGAAAPAPAPEAPVAAPVAPEPVAPVAEPVMTAAEPVAEAPATTAAVPAPKKKKKTGMIIGIILGLIAIGCGVAAILVFFVFNKGGDPVTNAMVRLLNNDERNIGVSGTFAYDYMGYPINVSYNAQIDKTAKAGVLTANLSGSFLGGDANVSLEGRATGDDNLYVKVDGIKDIVFSSFNVDCDSSDCDALLAQGLSTMDSSMDYISTMIMSLASIDGEWIKIEGVNILSYISLPTGLSFDDYNSHKSEVVELYKKYPFVTSSTNDLKISKKNDTLYKLGFDFDKMASFVNEISKSYCDKDADCGQKTVTASDLKSTIGSVDDVYVEVDGKGNFTRLYAGGTQAGDQDLSITYPANVNVSVPSSYKNFSEITSMFGALMGGLMGGSSSYSYSYGYDDQSTTIYTDDDDDDDSDWTWSWEETDD